MTVLDRLANRKTLTSAALAERTAQTRDEVAQRTAELAALQTRVAALDEEIRVAVVAAALDGAQNDVAISRARDERSAATRQMQLLTDRNETALLVIPELQHREHDALVAENTGARRKLAEEYDGHAARIRALLLEAAAHQEKAQRARHEEGELACAPCVQRADGLAAESLIPQTRLGPSLANVAQAYEAVDTGNRDLVRLMRMG